MITILVSLHRGSAFASKLIQWQTRSAYSHAGILLPDGRFVESREGHGVRVVRGLQMAHHEQVDLFEVQVTETQADEIDQFLTEQDGKPYDWTMVARFVSRRQANRESAGKWFCSELVFAAFQQAGVILLRDTQPWECSPGLLARSPVLKVRQLNITPCALYSSHSSPAI